MLTEMRVTTGLDMAQHNSNDLSTEGAMTLSQSMDSVNTTPEEEVSQYFFYILPFLLSLTSFQGFFFRSNGTDSIFKLLWSSYILAFDFQCFADSLEILIS